MSLLTFFANVLVAGSGYFARRHFEKLSTSLADGQWELLRGMLSQNAHCEYGEKYAFSSISSPSEYLSLVPVVEYADIEPSIERMKLGEKGVLTSLPVTIFEPTSGSVSASKYIPYTKTLLTQFQNAIGPWLWDIYWNRPHLLWGPAYWCITPLASRERVTKGGIPVGFSDDGDYLGGVKKSALSTVMVLPREISLIKSRRNFQYLTLLFLLVRKNLSVLSLWSPTFLLSLMSNLDDFRDRLADDIASGTIYPPEDMDPELLATLSGYIHASPARADEILSGMAPHQLWPELNFISTWASASAGEFIDELRALLPESEIQPKGLISTEGFVSFPLTGIEGGSVLAAGSHFFDFVEVDPDEIPDVKVCRDEAPVAKEVPALLAHELKEGRRYRVHITTGGGLYRYNTHDVVQVTGFYHDLPIIEFCGRDNQVADWFGEKLNPAFVQKAVDHIRGRGSFRFWMMALEKANVPYYCLFVDSEETLRDDVLTGFAHSVESELMNSHHYRGCRMLGQLGCVRVAVLRDGTGVAKYTERLVAEGKREGDIKPLVLDSVRTNWSNHFLVDRMSKSTTNTGQGKTK